MARENTPTPHPIDVHVGLRIRLRRKELGVSQEKLAEAIGLTFQQVQKYEKGANRVSASRLHQVATVLGCSVADFFPARAEALDPMAGLRDLVATADGRAMVEAFPRIHDPAVRQAVTRVIVALASA